MTKMKLRLFVSNILTHHFFIVLNDLSSQQNVRTKLGCVASLVLLEQVMNNKSDPNSLVTFCEMVARFFFLLLHLRSFHTSLPHYVFYLCS